MRKAARNKRSYNAPAPLNYTKQELVSLSRLDLPKLIKEITCELKRFHCTLEDICKTDFAIVVRLLLKVSQGLSSDDNDIRSKTVIILGEVFSSRSPIFHSSLKLYVGPKSMESKHFEANLEVLCDFFKVLLDKLPDTCWDVLPVDELSETIKMLADNNLLNHKDVLVSKLKDLADQRDAMKNQHRINLVTTSCQVSSSKKWDNREFRSVQILPLWDELRTPKPPYKLRPNIVEGKYDNWLHYYDVQFRLLREDFISPLRKGISDYFQGKVGRDLRNIKVYEKVFIIRSLFTRKGLCHKIRFDISHLKRCNWEHSKRLIFGSLLCLSPDNFKKEVFFATVSNRDPRELAQGYLEVMFQGGAEIVAHAKLKTKFSMVESSAYYEASQHILCSLQTAEVDTMPFTDYLISNEWESVGNPQYLENTAVFNLQCIVKDKNLCIRQAEAFNHVEISKNSQWPSLKMTDFDESQLNAIKMALTQEVAVIQGPPGTGKTYVGLKIVQVLLSNRHVWDPNAIDPFWDNPMHPWYRRHIENMQNSPILVMCYTNHALDQFLEEIIEMQNNEAQKLRLIRIGGRSKVKKIQQCNLREVKRELKNIPSNIYHDFKDLEEEAYHIGATCAAKMLAYYEHPKNNFIEFSKISSVIDEHHYRSLLDFAETEEEQKVAMELWLGLYERKVIEEYVQVDAFETSSSESDSDEISSEEDLVDEDEAKESGTYLQDEFDETIKVSGEANIEEEARYIDGITEMFKELKFGAPYIANEVKKKEKVLYNIKRITQIIPCEDQNGFKNWGMHHSSMEEYKVESIDDLHTLTLSNHWKLYKYWHSRYRKFLIQDLEDDCRKYNAACEEVDKTRQDTDQYALETAHVIGITTTGAAKYQHVLHMIKPKIVIVEEAAELLESHIVSALNAGTKHLILIGDHKQLRPKPNEYDLAVKYKLDISLFERLVRNNFPHTTLQIQHRMRPEIAELVKGHIYDTLENHKSVEEYPKIKGVSNNLFFIQHDNHERGSDDLSHSNDHEAKYLVALCKYLLQQGYNPSQITILVTYTGQLLVMKNNMPKITFEGIRVSTVDNFQGEENDIILLSLVRSNKEGNTGFLCEENRVCVSLSRAKHGFYCIGNFKMLRNQSAIWEKIVSDMVYKGKVGEGLKIHCNNHPDIQFDAISPDDFAKNSPNGGCQQKCSIRLHCGHQCDQKCHTKDLEHLKYKCKKKCNRECPEGHNCTKFCYEECRCTISVQRLLKCGHSQEIPCYKNPDTELCRNKCEKSCPKGHPCSLLCYKDCSRCKVKVNIRIPNCGHEHIVYCYQDTRDVKCQAKCEKMCIKEHPCKRKCYQECGDCMELVKVDLKCGHTADLYCYEDPNKHNCTELVTKTLKCGHVANLMCFEDPSSHICREPCAKKLRCGHRCTGLCGKECIKKCEVSDVKLTCPQGHKLTRKCYETFYPCEEKCIKKLNCGHPCMELCSKNCTTKCEVLVKKKYPCTHQHRIACSSLIEDNPCDIICKFQLACGHLCRGKCSECSTSRIHKPCESFVKLKHFCGEMIRMKCLGLKNTHEKPVVKDLHCMHKVIPYECNNEQMNQCNEPCIWACPHHQCSKLCHEQCDRPVCNERCVQRLDCGHQCVALCGEPCIKICQECDEKVFFEQLKSSVSKSYTQLPCGHIFSVQYMDRHVHQERNSVSPLLCPDCSSPLSTSGRYGNQMKESLHHVQAVRTILAKEMESNIEKKSRLSAIFDSIEKQPLFPAIFKSTSEFRTRFRFIGSNYKHKRLIFLYRNIKEMLKGSALISSEEMFLIVMFINVVKMFLLTGEEKNYIFQPLLNILDKMVLKKQPSYQVIHDFTSELYRLCIQAKVLVYQQSCVVASALTAEQEFLNQCDVYPNSRVSKDEFLSHSKVLDKKHYTKGIQVFESTEEFIRDLGILPTLDTEWLLADL